jgi:hypothetical protein
MGTAILDFEMVWASTAPRICHSAFGRHEGNADQISISQSAGIGGAKFVKRNVEERRHEIESAQSGARSSRIGLLSAINCR